MACGCQKTKRTLESLVGSVVMGSHDSAGGDPPPRVIEVRQPVAKTRARFRVSPPGGSSDEAVTFSTLHEARSHISSNPSWNMEVVRVPKD